MDDDLETIADVVNRAVANRRLTSNDIALLHDALQRHKEEFIDPSKGYGGVRKLPH
jgi:hypothetical protein